MSKSPHMGVRLAQFIFATAVAVSSGAAVVPRAPAHPGECRLSGQEKLPSALKVETVCQAIARAMAREAPSAHYRVEVQVLSKSRLSASLTVNGRTLPMQNMAVSDGQLSEGSVRRFADNLARLAVQ